MVLNLNISDLGFVKVSAINEYSSSRLEYFIRIIHNHSHISSILFQKDERNIFNEIDYIQICDRFIRNYYDDRSYFDLYWIFGILLSGSIRIFSHGIEFFMIRRYIYMMNLHSSLSYPRY